MRPRIHEGEGATWRTTAHDFASLRAHDGLLAQDPRDPIHDLDVKQQRVRVLVPSSFCAHALIRQIRHRKLRNSADRVGVNAKNRQPYAHRARREGCGMFPRQKTRALMGTLDEPIRMKREMFGTEPKFIEMETDFARFVKTFRSGAIVRDLIPDAPLMEPNAGYYFSSDDVIAELKCLHTDSGDREHLNKRFISVCERLGYSAEQTLQIAFREIPLPRDVAQGVVGKVLEPHSESVAEGKPSDLRDQASAWAHGCFGAGDNFKRGQYRPVARAAHPFYALGTDSDDEG